MKLGLSKEKYLGITSVFEAFVLLFTLKCVLFQSDNALRGLSLCTGLVSILTLLSLVLGKDPHPVCLDCFVPDSEYSHCFVCDTCVWRRDHHCPWMNTCIGGRNRTLFLAYLISTTACLYLLAQSFQENTQVLLLLLSTAVLFTCLAVYHAVLLLVGTRSAEFARSLQQVGD